MTTTRSSGLTYGDLQQIVESAIEEAIGAATGGYCWVWVKDMTDDVAIYMVEGETFEVPYSVDAGNVVTLGDPVPVIQVTTYEPVTETNSKRALFPPRPPRAEQRSAAPSVSVKREPLTYERHAPHSYYRDFILRDTNQAAAQRLQRHAVEITREQPRREASARARAEKSGYELRVNPNRVPGEGGEFAPPLWLIEEFATAKRPERVLADLIGEAGAAFPMPQGVQSINVPVLTSGTSVGPESDLEADPDADPVDGVSSSAVVTISGESDVAMQLLEQSPAGAHLDWVIFKDLTASYDADLEAQLLTGLGAAFGQLTGVTTYSTINRVVYTSATPTFSEMDPFIGQAAGQLGDARDLPPEVWLMRTARWSWIATSEDSALRPIVTPDVAPPPVPRGAEQNPIGSLCGWPVYLDDSILANLGAGTNQDQIIALRPSDLLLFEAEPRTSVMVEVLSGTLQARLQLRNYAAAITGRYPSGVATVSGTGMVVQSGF